MKATRFFRDRRYYSALWPVVRQGVGHHSLAGVCDAKGRTNGITLAAPVHWLVLCALPTTTMRTDLSPKRTRVLDQRRKTDHASDMLAAASVTSPVASPCEGCSSTAAEVRGVM
jgi:hypothetical protein